MKKYALMAYKNTDNLGDEIQTLAARQYIENVDEYVFRDEISNWQPNNKQIHRMIMNGWYSHAPENWPPSEFIEPLLISMHFSRWPGASGSMLKHSEWALTKPIVRYLREHGPVGARDLYTLDCLTQHDVPAYYSGCLTLTLQSPNVEADPDLIILNDVPPEIVIQVREKTNKQIMLMTHSETITRDPEARIKKAQKLLEIYARASCVITTRLHCALPCLAFGTPVLMLTTATDIERFSGLNRLYRSAEVKDFARCGFDINFPPPNNNHHVELAQALRTRSSNFIANSEITSAVNKLTSEEKFISLLEIHSKTIRDLETARQELLRYQNFYHKEFEPSNCVFEDVISKLIDGCEAQCEKLNTIYKNQEVYSNRQIEYIPKLAKQPYIFFENQPGTYSLEIKVDNSGQFANLIVNCILNELNHNKEDLSNRLIGYIYVPSQGLYNNKIVFCTSAILLSGEICPDINRFTYRYKNTYGVSSKFIEEIFNDEALAENFDEVFFGPVVTDDTSPEECAYLGIPIISGACVAYKICICKAKS